MKGAGRVVDPCPLHADVKDYPPVGFALEWKCAWAEAGFWQRRKDSSALGGPTERFIEDTTHEYLGEFF